MNRGAIHARCVLAGLRKLVLAFGVALIDEDLVIDRAGNDDELDVRNVFRREFGILRGGVCVSPAPTVM